MARIPTPALRGQEVGSVQSQFTPTPFQNLNPDADVFGAGQARALGQVSAGLSAAADGLIKQAKEDDNSVLLATQSGSMAFIQNLVNNPIDGLLTLQKNNAVGASKEALDKFASWKASVPQASTASGRAAQAAYFGQQEAQLYQTVSGHERTQRVEVRKEEYGTVIANSMQAMMANYLNPQALASNEELIRATTIRLSDTGGSSKEAAAEAAEKAVSDAYSGVLYRMIGNRDSEQARALHTELLLAGKLQPSKENTALATALDKVEAEEAGMKLGFKALAEHRGNPDKAAEWIARQPVSQEVKAAALTSMDQQNARVIRAESQQLSRIAKEQGERASKGEDLNEAAVARLSFAQQNAIIAIRDRARNPDQTTDKPAFSAYMRLTPTQRGALTEEDYVTQFYSKFDNKDQRNADVLYSAGKVAVGTAESSILRGKIAQQTDAQKAAGVYFEKQMEDLIVSLKFGPSASQQAKRSILEAALRSQFVVNNEATPQSSTDVDSFLNNAMRKFGTEGVYIGTLEFGRKLPDGTLPGNLSQVPRSLLSDMAMSYARSHNLRPDDALDPKDVAAWMDQRFFVSATTEAVPTRERDQIITQIRIERRKKNLSESLIAAPVAPADIRKRWMLYRLSQFVGGTHPPLKKK
jgi:hypothetical protein